MVGLPFLKIGLLGVRQATKPALKALIQSSKHHRSVYWTCVTMGRVSYAVSSMMAKSAAREQRETRVRQEAEEQEGRAAVAAAEKRAQEHGEQAATKSDAAAAATPSSTSSLGARKAQKPRKMWVTQSFHQTRLFFRHLKRTVTAPASQYPPVSETVLRDAGAELLLEFIAYFIFALVLIYEYEHTSRAAKAKERVTEARLKALEEKVNELTEHHHGEGVDVFLLPQTPVKKESVVYSLVASPVRMAKKRAQTYLNNRVDWPKAEATARKRAETEKQKQHDEQESANSENTSNIKSNKKS